MNSGISLLENQRERNKKIVSDIYLGETDGIHCQDNQMFESMVNFEDCFSCFIYLNRIHRYPKIFLYILLIHIQYFT
jgi:hypothetical protein